MAQGGGSGRRVVEGGAGLGWWAWMGVGEVGAGGGAGCRGSAGNGVAADGNPIRRRTRVGPGYETSELTRGEMANVGCRFR